MSHVHEESTWKFPPYLKKSLKKALKPLSLKSVMITKRQGTVVSGVLTTVCPIEKTESKRDFVVELDWRNGSVEYVSVDGKKLFPHGAKKGESRIVLARPSQKKEVLPGPELLSY